jgi:FolB domain-containing protein
MGEDRIEIKDLLLRGIVGINEWERKNRQDILINITLFGDLSPSGESDDIADTINYRTVTKKVIQHVENSQRFTVEALAADIARICLGEAGVKRARVRVEKPGALRFARSVGVEIERSREDFA